MEVPRIFQFRQDHRAPPARIFHMKISPLCSLVAASLLATSLPAYSQNAAAPNPATGDTKTATGDRGSTDVGLSKHDGITVSGADAFITRNGVTEKIAK